MKKMIFGDDVTIKFYQYRGGGGKKQSVIVKNSEGLYTGEMLDHWINHSNMCHRMGMDIMSTKYSFVWWL